ncbi:hypothetical protein PWT90_00964 [Aphanocladium album]|nr:hypothetical protein PWT90_00964 [Aphanocladium album]
MSGQEPFPQHSTPFPGAGRMSQPALLSPRSPRSHYRQLFSGGSKGEGRRRISQANTPYISPIPASTSSGEAGPESIALSQHHPPADDNWSAARAATADYTYNSAIDFTSTDDIIESDATDDCSDYESPKVVEDAVPFANAGRQEQRTSVVDDASVLHLPPTRSLIRAADAERELGHGQVDIIFESSVQSPDIQASERLFSMSGRTGSVSVATSLPPHEFEEKKPEKDLFEKFVSMAREESLQLGTTPSLVRHDNLFSSHTFSTREEPSVRCYNPAPPTRPPDTKENLNSNSTVRVDIKKPTCLRQSSPLPESFGLDELTSSIEFGYDGQSPYEVDDSDLEYTISDAIMDLYDLMSNPFWADDDKWPARISAPLPRGRVFTPYSNTLIKAATRLIDVIDQIKAKTDDFEQACFADDMNHRTTSLLAKMSDICTTIFQHTFKKDEKNINVSIRLHGETVQKIRKFVVPRYALIISKIFTLLCNPRPEMRKIVINILAQMCLDMGRIAKVIEFVAKESEEYAVTEVKEVMHSLAVVQEWVKIRQNTNGEGLARFIAL